MLAALGGGMRDFFTQRQEGISMPSRIRSLAVAAALAFATGANAQTPPPAAQAPPPTDVSTITRQAFIGSDQATIGALLMWLTGYYAAENDEPVIDWARMARNGEELGAFCAQNPTVGLITAAERIMNR